MMDYALLNFLYKEHWAKIEKKKKKSILGGPRGHFFWPAYAYISRYKQSQNIKQSFLDEMNLAFCLKFELELFIWNSEPIFFAISPLGNSWKFSLSFFKRLWDKYVFILIFKKWLTLDILRWHLKCHLIIFIGYYYYYSLSTTTMETNPLTISTQWIL